MAVTSSGVRPSSCSAARLGDEVAEHVDAELGHRVEARAFDHLRRRSYSGRGIFRVTSSVARPGHDTSGESTGGNRGASAEGRTVTLDLARHPRNRP